MKNQGTDKRAIWAACEKWLFRQRIILMCSMNRSIVTDLNGEALMTIKVGIDPNTLRQCTSPILSNPSTGEVPQAQRTAGGHRPRKNVPWKEPSKETNELKVMRSIHEYWLPVDPEWNPELLCDLCKGDPNISTTERSLNASYCIVCCSNASAEHLHIKDHVSKRRDFALIAMRIQIALERIVENQEPEIDIESDPRKFLLNVASGLIGSKGLGSFTYGEPLRKTLSHFGGVPVPVETIKGVFQAQRGKQYFCERENITDETTGKSIMVSGCRRTSAM